MSSPLPTFLQQLEACNLPHALSTYFGPAGMGFPALRWRLDDHFVLMLMMGMLGLSAHCLLHRFSASSFRDCFSVYGCFSESYTDLHDTSFLFSPHSQETPAHLSSLLHLYHSSVIHSALFSAGKWSLKAVSACSVSPTTCLSSHYFLGTLPSSCDQPFPPSVASQCINVPSRGEGHPQGFLF